MVIREDCARHVLVIRLIKVVGQRVVRLAVLLLYNDTLRLRYVSPALLQLYLYRFATVGARLNGAYLTWLNEHLPHRNAEHVSTFTDGVDRGHHLSVDEIANRLFRNT